MAAQRQSVSRVSSLRSLWPGFILVCACAGLSDTLIAQGGDPGSDQGNDPGRRSYSAIQVDAAPQMDGDVLGDPVWQSVAPTGGFSQTRPDAGQAASQRTEVRVIYTDEAIYFGFVCHDDDPATIVVSDSRRDASLEESDSLRIILDTYLDEQNGFVFGTNPAGIEYDGQVNKAGDGGSILSQAPGGSGGGFNINWDGVWQVKTIQGDFGWSAEFMILFKTLRYPSDEVQSWGFNIQRNIRRRNERSFWAPLDRQLSLFRLSDAGVLEDLKIPSQRNLKITPYILAKASDIGVDGKSTDAEVGFDLKYSLTPSLTLDLTYNTDFAQVEVDESQVTLDRFNLFFPEKRPFFLENAGLFTAGVPRQVELFFSRRIGLSTDGEVIPIKGGARISGALGGANVGLMYMQTEGLAGSEPANQFAVARVNRDLPNRSSVGAIFVNRQSTGSLAPEGDYNRTYGIDGRWGIGEFASVSGFLAKTSTPDLKGRDHSFGVLSSYDSEKWLLMANYIEVGENFNPEVGFLNRSAYRNGLVRILRRYRPSSDGWGGRWGIQELRPHISYNGYWDFDGFQETAFLHADNHIEWKNGYELHTAVNFTKEGLEQPFEISSGIFVPAGTYDNSELMIVAFTNQGAWISFNVQAIVGGFYSGDRVTVGPSMRMRLGEKFITEFSWLRNDVDLPQGDFVTDVGRLRLSYSFTPKTSLQALLQFNNVGDFWSTNLRFSWQRTANTGLYVVYDDIQGFDFYDGAKPNRNLVIKYTHLFDLF